MTLHHAVRLPYRYVAPRMETAPPRKLRRLLGLHVNGHDTSACVVEDGVVVDVVEFERVFREKACRVNVLHPRYDRSLRWLFEEYGLDPRFDAVALEVHHFGSEPPEYYDAVLETAVEKLRRYVPDAHYVQFNHHLCHAASGYFTSPFREACILSYDGHGNDGTTLGFKADGSRISYVKGWPFSMGRAYSALGNLIGGIHSQDGNSAGKTMGLTAYGQVIPEWIEPITRFIRAYQGIRSEFSPLYWEAVVADDAFVLPGFGPVRGKNAFKGPESKTAQDFAASFQRAWTEVALQLVRELVAETGQRNVCIVGGCALNAITNYHILQLPEVDRLHLIPHPNDAGLSTGAALYGYYAYQGEPWEGLGGAGFPAYLGLPVLDRIDLPALAESRAARRLELPFRELAERIAAGKILGVIQGRSEIGPRALGNRSILCDPRVAEMKETLNVKVKGREWYRPFAPVVREESVSRYFDVDLPTPYMSVIGSVKPEWAERLPAVTHVDGSARVQSVSRAQHPFLWDLLGAFEEITGVGVLLNTSFNGRGDPMIARISEGLELLDGTGLDAVFSDGWLFEA